MNDSRGDYNESKHWQLDADEEQFGRQWFGYGSFEAPYWFVGLEPGGKYDPLFARFWKESLNGAHIIDPRTDCREAPNPWFLPGAEVQTTWRPLIETVLAVTRSQETAESYQVERFGRTPPKGEIAAIELSAFAAPGSRSLSPHRYTFLHERIESIRLTLEKKKPVFCVFYGTSARVSYSKIVGGFDDDGFTWLGSTLCALIPHPAAWGRARAEWRGLPQNLLHRLVRT